MTTERLASGAHCLVAMRKAAFPDFSYSNLGNEVMRHIKLKTADSCNIIDLSLLFRMAY